MTQRGRAVDSNRGARAVAIRPNGTSDAGGAEAAVIVTEMLDQQLSPSARAKKQANNQGITEFH